MQLKVKLTMLVMALAATLVYPQQVVRGKVQNNKSEPIENVRVFVDSIDTGITSNARGFFEILVPKGTRMIHVYSKSYGMLSADYSGQQALTFMYIEKELSEESASDKVQVGYQEIDRKKLAIRVESEEVTAKDDPTVFGSIYDLMRVKLKGVIITNDNRIIIRGVNNLRGNTDPLFVVDGMIVSDIDFIRPYNVKSINLLKGPAASIYGSRGANGVIQIITKSD